MEEGERDESVEGVGHKLPLGEQEELAVLEVVVLHEIGGHHGWLQVQALLCSAQLKMGEPWQRGDMLEGGEEERDQGGRRGIGE